MPNVALSDLYMFADDTKLYRTITSESDCNTLQQDLNKVMDWGNTWLTNFNLHKCKILSFGIQVNIKNIYSMSCTSEVDGIEDENDLGVLFNSPEIWKPYQQNST